MLSASWDSACIVAGNREQGSALPWNLQFSQANSLPLSVSFNVCRFYATVAVLHTVFYPQTSPVHLSRGGKFTPYIIFFTALSQRVILLMNRTEVISEQISLFPSRHNAPDLHLFTRKIECRNQLEKK